MESGFFSNIKGFDQLKVVMSDECKSTNAEDVVDAWITLVKQDLFKKVESFDLAEIVPLIAPSYGILFKRELAKDLTNWFELQVIASYVIYDDVLEAFYVWFENEGRGMNKIEVKLSHLIYCKLLYKMTTLDTLKANVLESLVQNWRLTQGYPKRNCSDKCKDEECEYYSECTEFNK